MRWWLRSFGVGAAVGLLTGLVVGGTAGRGFMRLVFLAREDARGLETAMGATIGDFTAGGTLFIGIFGAAIGLLFGLVYVAGRTFLPSRLWVRELSFVLGACGLLLGLLVRINREDFALLPVTLSLVLIVASVLVTALPVPLLVERFAPDRARKPGAAARTVLGVSGVAIAVYAATGIAIAYTA